MARLLTGADRQRERALQEAMQTRLSASIRRGMHREIQRTMREMGERYAATGNVRMPDDHVPRVRALLLQDYDVAIRWAAGRITDAAGKGRVPHHRKAEGDPLFQRLLDAYMASFGTEKIVQITDTTRNQVRQLVMMGMRDGLGQREIAATIGRRASALAGLRANVIARTETHSASNYAALGAATETGLRMQKEWIAVNDARTRDDHIDPSVDGQTVAIDEPFSVMGTQMMYPGDPSAPPEQSVNCFDGSVKVSCDSLKKSIRSIYSGELITVKTAGGHEVTGTPNHPVMTDAGFIRLGEVDHLTNLLCCPLGVNLSGGLDVKDVPSSFEQVHDALSVVGASVRVGPASVNLYGRTPDGNVDVVRADSLLRGNEKAQFFKFCNEHQFHVAGLGKGFLFGFGLKFRASIVEFCRHVADSLMRSGHLRSPLLLSHFRPFQGFGFALSSDRNVLPVENGSNLFARNAVLGGDLVFARSRQVTVDDIGFGQPVSQVSKPQSRPSSAGSNRAFADPKVFSDFAARKSRFVHLDNVVDVKRRIVHNHPVYTIETDEGLYNAGGIIAGNCRCATGYVVLD